MRFSFKLDLSLFIDDSGLPVTREASSNQNVMIRSNIPLENPADGCYVFFTS